jgi:hypothetical protein
MSKKKGKQRRRAGLFFNRAGVPRAKHPWLSFKKFQELQQLMYKVEALAELPRREELPSILEASVQKELPVIQRRAYLSRLETEAMLLISALAFSPTDYWCNIVGQFLKQHGWEITLGGRPSVHPKEAVQLSRGCAIHSIERRMRPGLRMKQRARRDASEIDRDQLAARLRCRGFGDLEIKCILQGRTPQDAACRFFQKAQTSVHLSLKTIRNSVARYKLLKRRGMRP